MADIMIPAWIDGTLMPVEKLEAHQLGAKHKAVSVFVVRGTQVLLQRRALGKYHTPGLWANTCCTHPRWDESSKDCAVRRLKEELDVTGYIPEFRQKLEYRADVGQGLTEHEVVDVFLVKISGSLTFTANPDEVMETRWVEFEALLDEVQRTPDQFTPWLKIYLSDFSAEIFGQDTASLDEN